MYRKYLRSLRRSKSIRKEIKKQLTESSTTDYDTQLQDEAWNAVLEKAEVKKYPDGDVEDIENQIKEQYQNAADSYGLAFEDFLHSITACQRMTL